MSLSLSVVESLLTICHEAIGKSLAVIAEAKIGNGEVQLKKEKRKRDPSKPKPAQGAWLYYYGQERAAFVKKHPDVENKQVMGLMAAEYKKLSPQERKKYEDLHAADVGRHEKEMKQWNADHPDQVKKQKTTTESDKASSSESKVKVKVEPQSAPAVPAAAAKKSKKSKKNREEKVDDKSKKKTKQKKGVAADAEDTD
jgi:hypothetical protein